MFIALIPKHIWLLKLVQRLSCMWVRSKTVRIEQKSTTQVLYQCSLSCRFCQFALRKCSSNANLWPTVKKEVNIQFILPHYRNQLVRHKRDHTDYLVRTSKKSNILIPFIVLLPHLKSNKKGIIFHYLIYLLYLRAMCLICSVLDTIVPVSNTGSFTE